MSEPAQQGASGANPGKPVQKRAPSQRVQAERNDQVIALSNRGLGPDEIARKLGMTGGEVALVLNLDRSRDDKD